MSSLCYIFESDVAWYAVKTRYTSAYLWSYVYDVHTHNTQHHLQNSYTWFAWVQTQNLMEACLMFFPSNYMQPLVSKKTCNFLFYFLNYETIRKSENWHTFISNLAQMKQIKVQC